MDILFFHRKVRPMKQKGCAASRAEQKLRFPENLDARVCEAHFCSINTGYIVHKYYLEFPQIVIPK